MLTQPNVLEFYQPPVGAPSWEFVFPAIWDFFSDKVTADAVAEKVKAIPGVSDVTVTDGASDGVLGLRVKYLDATTKAWVVQGKYGDGSNTYKIIEWAGSISDRSTKPNLFTDKPNGPNLRVRIVNDDAVELYWGV